MSRRRRLGPTFTYVFRCTETGRYKIGRSVSPFARFYDIYNMSPTELEFVGCLDLDEWEAHQMVKAWRVKGEWFAPSDHVCAVIRDFLLPVEAWYDQACAA